VSKIAPFLWFDNHAEEAMNFYISIFKNSKVLNVSHYGEGSPGQAGSVMTVSFELDGQEFLALNGGPVFSFSPATSFFVTCGTQEEVDHYWEKLSDGGEKQKCGWLRDKFDVTWQIVPAALGELMGDPDPEKSKRVMDAMLQMDKIDIALLRRAHSGID